MKFWDTSAILPLLVDEVFSAELKKIYQKDPYLIVWWGTKIEAVSALSRLERDSEINVNQIIHTLDAFSRTWMEVEPADEIRELSIRLLRVHNLRAADSLQLAAAILASNRRPSSISFVSRDERLSYAAEKEGFTVL